MARVTTTTDDIDVDGDYGGSVDGVEVTCDRCGHSEQCAVTHEGSLRHCAFLIREDCPRGENNFYVVDD